MLNEVLHKKILKFIRRYRRVNAANCYSKEMDRRFAQILQDRFSDAEGVLVYDAKHKHFGCMIGDYVYDINGDVSEGYNWVLWNIYDKEEIK